MPFAHRVFGRDGQLLDMALSYLCYGMSCFRKDIFVQTLKSIACKCTYIPSIVEDILQFAIYLSKFQVG